jgi:hypothetical protein
MAGAMSRKQKTVIKEKPRLHVDHLEFSDAQLKQLSDILGNLGHVMIASVAIPVFFDKGSPLVVALGVIAAIACWVASIWLLKGMK